MMRLRILLPVLLLLCCSLHIQTKCIVYAPNIKTVQAVVNNDWLSPPVMVLNSQDVIQIDFDELSHEYHRFVYTIEHCEADWSKSEGIFESDYLDGFNNIQIEEYENSRGTIVPYTHYKLQIPNEYCKLKMSGNYRLTVYDENEENRKMFQVEFMVAEQSMAVSMEVKTNTDIDFNKAHQQLDMSVRFPGHRVTNIDLQIYTVIRQNDDERTTVINPKPTFIKHDGLEWSHHRDLIFQGGNEYRKFETLALSHSTLGIDKMWWDGDNYHAYLFMDEPRPNYIYDQDANGAFYIRNSDNFENETTCDYVYVHYSLKSPNPTRQPIYVHGWWTTDADISQYEMQYNEQDDLYHQTILQKQGYYSYHYVQEQQNLESEGNYYQTENRYQLYVYFRSISDRTWRLTAYRQLFFK
ncbi:MAG: DUF5103 domain-containing protein [Prevotella sp.]